MKGQLKNLVFILGTWFSSLALAHEVVRPRNFHDYTFAGIPLAIEDAIALGGGARVVWANFELIRHDFPQIAHLSNEEICNWLLKNFAYVGSKQQMLNGIRNTEIPVDDRPTKKAFRPNGWNRSAVLEAFSVDGKEVIGMVDVKGFGHGSRSYTDVQEQVKLFAQAHGDLAKLNALRTKDHSDGLMSLGEAIAEVSRQIAAQMLFDLNNTGLETVENYAIIELPIKIYKKNNQIIPAGMVLRQAHFGRRTLLAVPSEIYIDPFGNRQRTDSDSAVDFGGVIITNPQLRDSFGFLETATDETDPQKSRAWIYAHDVAEAIQRGDLYAIYRHLDEMLAPIKEEYPKSADVRAAQARRKKEEELAQQLRVRGARPREIISALKEQRRQFQSQFLNFANIQQALLGTDAEACKQALAEVSMISDPRAFRLILATVLKTSNAKLIISVFAYVNLPYHLLKIVVDEFSDELIAIFSSQQKFDFSSENEVHFEFAVRKFLKTASEGKVTELVEKSKNDPLLRSHIIKNLFAVPAHLTLELTQRALESPNGEFKNQGELNLNRLSLAQREIVLIPYIKKHQNFPWLWLQYLPLLKDSVHPELIEVLLKFRKPSPTSFANTLELIKEILESWAWVQVAPDQGSEGRANPVESGLLMNFPKKLVSMEALKALVALKVVVSDDKLFQLLNSNLDEEYRKLAIQLLNNLGNEAVAPVALKILRSLPEETKTKNPLLVKDLLEIIAIHGSKSQLEIFKLPKFQVALRGELIEILSLRRKDQLALPIIRELLLKGFIPAPWALESLIRFYGDLLPLKQLQNNPRLNSEMQFLIYSGLNPPNLKSRCQWLFFSASEFSQLNVQ